MGIRDPATLPDDDLIRAYRAPDGEPGDLVVEALLVEIEKRNLDL